MVIVQGPLTLSLMKQVATNPLNPSKAKIKGELFVHFLFSLSRPAGPYLRICQTGKKTQSAFNGALPRPTGDSPKVKKKLKECIWPTSWKCETVKIILKGNKRRAKYIMYAAIQQGTGSLRPSETEGKHGPLTLSVWRNCLGGSALTISWLKLGTKHL